MLRRSLLPLIVLFTACSPAAPPPPRVAEAPKAAPTPPPAPPPSGAKWLFPGVEGYATSELDLGERGVLQVGERGRRWWVAKDGSVQQPTDVAPEDLVDVRAEGAGFLLLGDEGGVFITKDPIGKIETSHPGPTAKHAIFRAGQKALLGVQPDGTLHRSTDAGATWSASKLPLKAGETVASLGANRKGHAVVVLRPQRVLVSIDDGATWTATPTSGIGARDVVRDRKDDLYLRGAFATKYAKLGVDSTPRFVTGGAPEKLTSRKEKKTEDWVEIVPMLAGDRHVTVTETYDLKNKTKDIALSIAPLGGTAAGVTTFVKGGSERARVTVGGYQGTVVVAWTQADGDSTAWRIKRTNDDGKTWEDLGESAVHDDALLDVLVGPQWVAVASACSEDDDSGYGPPTTTPCAPAKVKIGSKPWQPLELPSGLELRQAIFDPPRNRVFVVAAHQSYGELQILTGKADGTVLTELDVELPDYSANAITVDAQGMLRLIFGRELLRFDAELNQKPTLHLPFAAYEVSLAGERGFAHASDDGYETNDGGEHWVKVTAGAGGAPRCTAAGCIIGDVVRAGWELPNTKLELLASTHKPPKVKPAAPPAAAPPPVSVSCAPKGAWSTVPGSTYNLAPALDGDVRFLSVQLKQDGAEYVTVVRGAAAPKTTQLLGPDPALKKAPPAKKADPKDPKAAKKLEPKVEASAPPSRVRYGSELDAHGYAAARYTFSLESKGEGKYNPVDVELGWYSAASGKTAKAKLPQVPAFRVGSAGKSALLSIVDGGILFLPYNGTSPLYRVKDDGKVTALTRPPAIDSNVPWTTAVEVGGTIYLAALRGDDVAVASSPDGKTWKTMAWTTGGSPTLAVVDGKARLAIAARLATYRSVPKAMIAVEPLGNDPGEVKLVDAEGLHLGPKGLLACSAKSRGGLRSEVFHARGDRTVTIDFEGDKGWVKGNDKLTPPITLAGSSHVTRTGEDGGSCVDLVSGMPPKGSDLTALVSPHDMTHGWLVRRSKEQKDGPSIEVRPMSCTIAK